MKPREILHLYQGWVRFRCTRELMAIGGVAIGVALVFSTITANLSIAGSANRIIHSLAGSAQLQVTARRPQGVLERQIMAPGIAETANILEYPVTICNGHRIASTQIVGGGAGVIALNPMIANIPPSSGLILPSNLASSLHVREGSIVTIDARGRQIRQIVGEVLGWETIGSLADSHLAFGSLNYAQRLLGLPGRVSMILIKTVSGKTRLAERELRRMIEPGMEVTNTTIATRLLNQALRPQDQSTLFFALLGTLVGVLLIVTTTMLTLADRRSDITQLRLMGFPTSKLVQIVLSQGVILGGAGSLLGIAIGWWLAVDVFRSNPEYLASAFSLGTGTIISIPLIIGLWWAGVIVTCACVGWALVDRPSVVISLTLRHRLLAAAGVLLIMSLAFVRSAPLLAALVLTLALFGSVPAWVNLVMRIAGRPVVWLKWMTRAAGTIRASPVRSVGLAATAAIGVFGATVAQGSHADLLRGLETGYAHYVQSADLWVASPGDSLATNSFPNVDISRLRHVSGVTAARAYYGGWVDMAGRRVWLISRSGRNMVPIGEIVHGRQSAEQRLGSGGWVALSGQLAEEMDARIGSVVTIPTPSGPKQYRLAATTTNLGWSSGVLFLPAVDYVRYWPDAEPSAIEINGYPNLTVLQRLVGSGLTVQTSVQRARTADALPRQGLERLSQIAWLLIISATFAVALALGASLWQRRGEFASQRLQSFTSTQLQKILVCEALLIVGSGAVLGAVAGIYGHFAADQYLHDSTGYPIAWTLGVFPVIGIVCLVAAATVLILVVPGRIATRSPLRLAFGGR